MKLSKRGSARGTEHERGGSGEESREPGQRMPAGGQSCTSSPGKTLVSFWENGTA